MYLICENLKEILIVTFFLNCISQLLLSQFLLQLLIQLRISTTGLLKRKRGKRKRNQEKHIQCFSIFKLFLVKLYQLERYIYELKHEESCVLVERSNETGKSLEELE